MSVPSILLDTNIIIDFLRGKGEAIDFFQSLPGDNQLCISTITATELYAGVKGKKEEESINLLLEGYTIHPVSFSIAKQGGLIKKKFGPSHGIGIADGVIAATAIEHKAKLVTLNVKHFPMVNNKEAPY